MNDAILKRIAERKAFSIDPDENPKEYRAAVLNRVNKKCYTDRDELLGIGEKRVQLWEKIGVDIPFPAQVDILMSPAKETYVVSSRGAGKSEVAAWRIKEELLLPNRQIYLVSPYHDLNDIIFERVWNDFRNIGFLNQYMAKTGCLFNKQDRQIITEIGSSRSKIQCFSGDNADGLVGKSADLIIIDEAALLKDEAFTYLEPALSRAKHMGRLLALSSPRDINYFAEKFKVAESNDERFRYMKAVRMHLLDNPWGDHQNYYNNLEYAKAVDTPYQWSKFLQEYEAEFATGTGDVFYFTEDIWYPKNFWVPKDNEPIYIGVDYAQLHDYTVCSAFTGDYIQVGYDRFNKLEDNAMLHRIAKFIMPFVNGKRNIKVVIDCTGDSTSAITRDVQNIIANQGRSIGVSIRPEKFTLQLKHKIIEKLKVKIGSEDVCFWDIPEVRNEFKGFVAEKSGAGNIIYKASGNGHDDVVFSFGLAIYEIPDSPFQVY